MSDKRSDYEERMALGWGDPARKFYPSPALASHATLRDKFAGDALMGMLCGRSPVNTRVNPSDEKCVAEQAYMYADAMIKARGW